jgi:endonuclease G
VRTWAWENGAVYIATGPVLTESTYNTIGPNKVAVPEYFYKVILDYRQPDLKALGFVLPNKKGSLPLPSYAVSVDRVEEITGIDFYHGLPDDIEEALESDYDITKWIFKRFSTQQNQIESR